MEIKKLLLLTVSLVIIIACSNKTSDSSSAGNSAAQQNFEAIHNISRAFETGDTSLLTNSVATDFVDHRDYGDVKGMDSLKAFVLSSHEHIKNLKMKTVKELADDEYAMSWVQFSGTGDGEAGTMPGEFNVTGVEIVRFKNGKAVEHWEAMDMRDVTKMVQKLTADQNGVMSDSTNAQ